MSHWLDKLKTQARQQPRHVLLPETDDSRILQAAKMLVDEQLAIPVFESAEHSVEGAVVLQRQKHWPALNEQVKNDIQALLADKGVDAISAAQANPLWRAAIILNHGIVNSVVCGSIATTGDVLRAGIKGVGVSEAGLVASSFILDWQGRALSFADCAVNPDPNSEQLASIAIAAAETHQRLTGEIPRIALLSLATRGSASHPLVDKVHQATQILRQQRPDLQVDGEMQFDAALVPEIAERKAPDSEVAGQANVFIFPNLDAGNIGYKIAERMGGATATGPILNGLKKPWLDLSRGCSAQDIVNLSVIGGSLSQS